MCEMTLQFPVTGWIKYSVVCRSRGADVCPWLVEARVQHGNKTMCSNHGPAFFSFLSPVSHRRQQAQQTDTRMLSGKSSSEAFSVLMDRIVNRLEMLFCSPQSSSNKQISKQQSRSDQFLVSGYLQAMVRLTNTHSFFTYPDWLVMTTCRVAKVSLTNTPSFSTYPHWFVMTIYSVAMVSEPVWPSGKALGW